MKDHEKNSDIPTRFSVSSDFEGLKVLITRLKEETLRHASQRSFDAIYEVIDGLNHLEEGLSQLRHDRWSISEERIDSFIDLLRGMKPQKETRSVKRADHAS